MTRFVVRRLMLGLLTLWVVITLTFGFLRIIPGGPFDKERVLPPEIQANIDAFDCGVLRYLQSLVEAQACQAAFGTAAQPRRYALSEIHHVHTPRNAQGNRANGSGRHVAVVGPFVDSA